MIQWVGCLRRAPERCAQSRVTGHESRVTFSPTRATKWHRRLATRDCDAKERKDVSNLYSSYSGQSATVEKLANGVEWIIRPYRDADIPAIVTLINSAEAVDKLDEGISEEELRTKFASPRSDPVRQIIVVEGPLLE